MTGMLIKGAKLAATLGMTALLAGCTMGSMFGGGDDQRFADVYARQRMDLGYGPLRILAELQQRGVHFTPECLDEVSEEDWCQRAVRLRAKRYGLGRLDDDLPETPETTQENDTEPSVPYTENLPKFRVVDGLSPEEKIPCRDGLYFTEKAYFPRNRRWEIRRLTNLMRLCPRKTSNIRRQAHENGFNHRCIHRNW